MALGVFIAGRYSSTLNSVSLGIMREGYELSMEPHHQLINRSDAFGDTLIETILRGADWALQCDALEYTTGPKNAISQVTGTLGTLGVIGRLGSDVAQSLVLTSTAGTPAATSPISLTALKTMLAPNANPRLKFTSELREVPMRFVFFPFDAGAGVITFFTMT